MQSSKEYLGNCQCIQRVAALLCLEGKVMQKQKHFVAPWSMFFSQPQGSCT